MAQVNDHSIQWAFSTKKQAAYATALQDDSLSESFPFRGPDMVDRTEEIELDGTTYGRGHEHDTSQLIRYYDVKLKRSFPMTSFMAAWIASSGFWLLTVAGTENFATCL